MTLTPKLTIRQVADRLQFSREWVRRRIAQAHKEPDPIPYYVISRRFYFDEAELAAWWGRQKAQQARLEARVARSRDDEALELGITENPFL